MKKKVAGKIVMFLSTYVLNESRLQQTKLLNNLEPEIKARTKQLSRVDPKFEFVYKKTCTVIQKP